MQSISVLEAGNATLAQLVEQRIRNAQVEGSNPLSGSLTALDLRIPGGFLFVVGTGFHNKKPLTFCEGFSAVRMGLEPTTSGVTGPHSNQLNYRTG